MVITKHKTFKLKFKMLYWTTLTNYKFLVGLLRSYYKKDAKIAIHIYPCRFIEVTKFAYTLYLQKTCIDAEKKFFSVATDISPFDVHKELLGEKRVINSQ